MGFRYEPPNRKKTCITCPRPCQPGYFRADCRCGKIPPTVPPVSPCVPLCRAGWHLYPLSHQEAQYRAMCGALEKRLRLAIQVNRQGYFPGRKNSRRKEGGRKRPSSGHFAQQCWAFLRFPIRWSDLRFDTVKVVGMKQITRKQRLSDGHLRGGRLWNRRIC
jgi:hypothetical protein